MMKTTKIFLSLLVFMIFSLESFSQGFPDGNHKGLILGLHGLVGHTSYKFDNTHAGMSYGAGGYIGYGFSEQFLLNFRVRWAMTDADGFGNNTVMWSGDLNYFPIPEKGLYLNGGIGPILNAPEFGNPKTGFGIYAGAGYEIIKKLSIGFDYTYASFEDDLTGSTIAVYLRFLFY
jgi:opacity protein-like surface antigen